MRGLTAVLCAFLLMSAPAYGEAGPRFTEVSAEWGVYFKHNNGAFGKKYLPETMGSGVALMDANGDGRLDILFVNGMDWPGRPTGRPQTPAYFEQAPPGSSPRFIDKTAEAGFHEPIYGMGAAAADYDNDGDADIFIAALGADKLYRNDGTGRFEEVSKEAGVQNERFGASAAWFDADNDGHLDLYICNYVEWSIEKDIFCTLDGTRKSYCSPESYEGAADRLYKNNGDGTFTDASEAAGVHDPTSKSLGVVAFDHNGDGRMDLFVSNDTEPDKLYENIGGGRFEEIGMLAGIAFDEAGIARAGMGVDAADENRSGRATVAVGNFSNEMISLHRNEGNGLFIDAAAETKMGAPSFLTLAFGLCFLDADADGWVDLLVANGHIENEIEKVRQNVQYAQRPHLFRNRGGKLYVDAAAEAGLTEPMVGRGAAYGDMDGDGDLDIVLTANGGEARVYRNDSSKSAGILRIRLTGSRSNRDAVGAKAVLKTAGGRQTQTLKGGGSYCSQSEKTLTFGLGDAAEALELVVTFPSGKAVRLANVAANQLLEIHEEKGLASTRSVKR